MKVKISEVASLMEEYKLSEAEYEEGGERILFRRNAPQSAPVPSIAAPHETQTESEPAQPEVPAAPAAPMGVPVSSPMAGIFYPSPSPNAPPFVKEGGTVTAGQVVALIEAMKVFNEITAATSGTVLSVVAESGQLVQPGDPLLYIG